MSNKFFTFNWHDLPEGDFLKWMYITLITDADFADLQEHTDKGNAVTLRIFANDIELNVANFIKSLKMNYELAIRDTVTDLCKEIRLDDLADAVAEVEKQIKQDVERRFRDIGIVIEHDDSDW